MSRYNVEFTCLCSKSYSVKSDFSAPPDNAVHVKELMRKIELQHRYGKPLPCYQAPPYCRKCKPVNECSYRLECQKDIDALNDGYPF